MRETRMAKACAVVDLVHDPATADPWDSGLMPLLLDVIDADSVALMEFGQCDTVIGHREFPVMTIDDADCHIGFGKHLASCPFCHGDDRRADRYGVLGLADIYSAPGQHAQQPGTEYFGDYTPDFGLEIGLQATGTQRALLYFARTSRFGAADRRLLGLLRPHLQSAYRRSWQARGVQALTGRQREVLSLVAAGRTTPEIAEHLTLSPGTVRKHLDNIFERLGVANRRAAARYATTVTAIPSSSGD